MLSSHHFEITLSHHFISHRAGDLSRDMTYWLPKYFLKRRHASNRNFISSYVSMMTAVRERRMESHTLALKMCPEVMHVSSHIIGQNKSHGHVNSKGVGKSNSTMCPSWKVLCNERDAEFHLITSSSVVGNAGRGRSDFSSLGPMILLILHFLRSPI